MSDKSLVMASDYAKLLAMVHAYKLNPISDRIGRLENIRYLFNETRRANVMLSNQALSMVIDTFSRSGLEAEINDISRTYDIPIDPSKLLMAKISSGVPFESPEIQETFTAAIKQYGDRKMRLLVMNAFLNSSREDKESCIMQQFEKLESEGRLDATAYKHVIIYYCESGKLAVALDYLNRMPSEWKPLVRVFIPVIKALVNSSRFVEALKLFEKLDAANAHYSREMYEIKMRCLAASGLNARCLELWSQCYKQVGDNVASLVSGLYSNGTETLVSDVESTPGLGKDFWNQLLVCFASNGNFDAAAAVEQVFMDKDWEFSRDSLSMTYSALLEHRKEKGI